MKSCQVFLFSLLCDTSKSRQFACVSRCVFFCPLQYDTHELLQQHVTDKTQTMLKQNWQAKHKKHSTINNLTDVSTCVACAFIFNPLLPFLFFDCNRDDAPETTAFCLPEIFPVLAGTKASTVDGGHRAVLAMVTAATSGSFIVS